MHFVPVFTLHINKAMMNKDKIFLGNRILEHLRQTFMPQQWRNSISLSELGRSPKSRILVRKVWGVGYKCSLKAIYSFPNLPSVCGEDVPGSHRKKWRVISTWSEWKLILQICGWHNQFFAFMIFLRTLWEKIILIHECSEILYSGYLEHTYFPEATMNGSLWIWSWNRK